MKGKKTCLKKRYAKRGAKAYPLGVDQKQWDKLMIYWQQCDTKIKNEHMVDVRWAITNVSHLGRGGKAIANVKLVS